MFRQIQMMVEGKHRDLRPEMFLFAVVLLYWDMLILYELW